jgi:preprotein translocase subunit SecB
MMGASEMRLINYKVLKINFKLNEEFETKEEKIFIQPFFHRDVIKIDDMQYKINLSVNISSELNKNQIPFNTEITISTVFELANWENEGVNKIAIDNGTAIMFPYLRNLLSTITMNANIPPYTLPIVNVLKLFIKDVEKK